MVIYGSKKTSSSYVFYSFCCSAPNRNHSSTAGWNSKQLPSCKMLTSDSSAPKPSGHKRDTHLGSSFRSLFSALQKSSHVLRGTNFLP